MAENNMPRTLVAEGDASSPAGPMADAGLSGDGKRRSSWSGKWAFILAAAASAVGLGNLWRFPYLAARFGGGMFLVTYVLLVFTVGISLLLVETALGRHTRQSVIGAFSHYGRKHKYIGVLASAVPFIITPYYCIIGGWVTKYLVSYFTLSPDSISDAGGESGTFFSAFIGGGNSYLYMLIFMAIVFVVIALGVQNGIEKSNLIMMPALIVMTVGIAVFVLMQPGAAEGARYYLIPDWSKFSPDLLINALGQMFYSLSLAMGIMVTYGSYMKREDSLTQSVSCIAGFDFFVSFFAGIMIVPAAFVALGSAEAVASKAGPSLMFITLPQVFDTMGAAAAVVGAIFFLLVLFAALTSAISLSEACVSIIQDGMHWSRAKSVVAALVVIVGLGVFVDAGYNGLSFIQPMGEGSTLLDFFDFISNSVLMPIVAFLTCVFVGWVIKPKELVDEVRVSSKFRLAGVWSFMVKYVCPVLVAIILLSNVVPLIIGS